MSEISERLLCEITNKNMSYGELSKATGIPKSALQRYATGETVKIPLDRIELIASALNINSAYLMGWASTPDIQPDLPSASNIIPMPTMRKVPVVGTIACGEPILAEENIECDVDIPDNIRADFALRCDGESMIEVDIRSGDIVYIRKQDMVDNGQIAAVLINETCDEARATLKRVYYNREIGELRLVPENRREPTRVFTGEDLNSIRILGLAVGLTRSLDGE